MPKGFSDTTLTAPFNNSAAVEAAFEAHPGQIAAVIVEPVCGNMGCIPPKAAFLADLRDITAAHGALLIFDEVMTGFRVAAGGAQQLYDVTPDLTTLGKVIGAGLPIAAYGGRRDIMSWGCTQRPRSTKPGTPSQPTRGSAGLAAVRHLQAHPEIYNRLNRATERLAASAPPARS